jgi:hypothetical protein
MEKQKVAIGKPVAVRGVTLVPLEKVSLNYWRSMPRGVWSVAIKQPLAVVVVSPPVRRAFRITGEEIPLDQLILEAPGIEEVLADIQASN